MAGIDLVSQGPSFPQVKLSLDPKALIDFKVGRKHILIIGGGVSGLMTAWILLDKGFRVTIIAEHWAWTKDWQESRLTSQIAGALWEFPPGGCGVSELAHPEDPKNWASLEHYREWALQSYEFYKNFSKLDNARYKAEFGGSITRLHSFFYHSLTEGDAVNPDDRTKHEEIKKQYKTGRIDGFELGNLENIVKEAGIVEKDLKDAYTHLAPIINTDRAMVFLMSLLRNKGAEMVTRRLTGNLGTIGWDLKLEYEADAIVNATGLGARELANDTDVFPVRGAIKRINNENDDDFKNIRDAYLVPFQKDKNLEPSKTIFIVPRNDETLIVGSIIQRFTHEPDLIDTSPEVEIMWKRARKFLPALNDTQPRPEYPFAQGLRPFTKNNVKVRAEKLDVGKDKKESFHVVHNYGHGGSGWTLAVGCARTAVFLLEKIFAGVEAKSANDLIYPFPKP